MSFSGEVKRELATVEPQARHCRIAEIAGLSGSLGITWDGAFVFQTENEQAARKIFTLLQKTYNIETGLSVSARNGGQKQSFRIALEDEKKIRDIQKAVRHPMLLAKDCCRRAFLRGAFIGSGSISAPEKYYHLEVVCTDRDFADQVCGVMREMGLDGKIVLRKKTCVVYIKEADQIVTMLGEMGAGYSLMNLENVRILREMKGSINRRVNCETANMNRTAVMSARQIRDIMYIRDHGGLGQLKPRLREVAEARLMNPEASLGELGMLLASPIGKSGVNHRLQKLSAIAEELKQKEDSQGVS